MLRRNQIRLLRWLWLGPKRGHIPAGRSTEHPAVLSTKLRGAFVPDPEGCFSSLQTLAQHQPPGLLKAEPLLVLEWAQPRHPLEVEVEGRWAHPDVLRQPHDAQPLGEMVPEPPDGPCDPVRRCPGRRELPKPGPQRSGEQAVGDFAEDQRSECPDILRCGQECQESD